MDCQRSERKLVVSNLFGELRRGGNHGPAFIKVALAFITENWRMFFNFDSGELFALSTEAIRKSVESHLATSLHRECVAQKNKPQLESIEGKLRELHSHGRARARETMGNLMRAALHLASNKKAMLQFEELVYLLDLDGADVGDRDHSRKTAATMIEVIVQVGQRQLLIFLKTKNPLMNHKPHIFVKADKASDRKMRQFEIVNIRVNYCGRPLILHLEIRPIGSGDYTESVPGADGTSPEAAGRHRPTNSAVPSNCRLYD